MNSRFERIDGVVSELRIFEGEQEFLSAATSVGATGLGAALALAGSGRRYGNVDLLGDHDPNRRRHGGHLPWRRLLVQPGHACLVPTFDRDVPIAWPC